MNSIRWNLKRMTFGENSTITLNHWRDCVESNYGLSSACHLRHVLLQVEPLVARDWDELIAHMKLTTTKGVTDEWTCVLHVACCDLWLVTVCNSTVNTLIDSDSQSLQIYLPWDLNRLVAWIPTEDSWLDQSHYYPVSLFYLLNSFMIEG